jgi:hypothetical protein
MKRLVNVVVFPLMLLSETGAAALSRLDLDRLALDVWRLRSAFHAYTVMQGNALYLEQLEEVIADTDDVVNTLRSSAETDAEKVFIEALDSGWQRYRDLAGQNTVADLGYTAHYTIVDLESEALSLSRIISQQRQGVSAKSEDLADLAVRLQRITSEYMFTASAPDGGSGAIGTGAEEGRLAFDEAVPDFDARLQVAQKAWAGSPDVARELRSVASKWAFIRESLVKFNENSVPYVVHRYSRQMVGALNNAAEMARQ